MNNNNITKDGIQEPFGLDGSSAVAYYFERIERPCLGTGMTTIWYHHEVLDAEISLLGYILIRRDRPDLSNGGEVLLLIKEGLDPFASNFVIL